MGHDLQACEWAGVRLRLRLLGLQDKQAALSHARQWRAGFDVLLGCCACCMLSGRTS